METQKNSLTPEQSLDLITRMIDQAKGNIQRNAFYFLLWGWIVALANIGMYVLAKLDYQHPYVVWAITIPTWIFTLVKSYKKGESKAYATHLDRISSWLWFAFGICIFTLVAFGSTINYQLNPVILLVAAIPTFVSGVIMRFKPLMFGGAMFWVLSIVSFLVARDLQPVVGALAIICGYLVPGYMLKQKEAK
jgi:hypothetical protein